MRMGSAGLPRINRDLIMTPCFLSCCTECGLTGD